MTDDEIALWLITKGTMEDKPVLSLAADRILRMRAERDEALECNEEFFVDNQFLKKRVEETRKEWEGWQSASVKLMKQVTALTAERDRMQAALTALHKQALMLRGEQAYREFARAVEKQARAALKGETP